MIPGSQLAEDLDREWNQCAAEGVPLTLPAVSLDHPQAGDHDEALTHLDRALRVHCARDRNRVTRRDNGIFIAFLPATAPPGARHVGEEVVEAIHHTPQPTATVSVGVAAVVPSASDEPASLLTRAERALHAAQAQGGDRCAGGSAPTPPPRGALAQLRDLWPKTTNRAASHTPRLVQAKGPTAQGATVRRLQSSHPAPASKSNA